MIAPGLATAFATVRISQSTASQLSLSGPLSGSASTSAGIGPFTVTLGDASGNPVPAPAGGYQVTLSSTSQGTHEFAASAAGPPLANLAIPAGSSSASFFYGDSTPGAATITASAPGLAPAHELVEVATAMNLVGPGLDSPVSPASPSQVQSWYDAGYRNIFLNTFAPSFAQQYASSIARLHVILFQGYYTPAFLDETGAQRAQEAIDAAQSVGYPQGAYIFVDVESTGTATQQLLIAWIDSWSEAVRAAGYGAGVYYGLPQPLSASEASSVVADRFWKSCSSYSVTPALRGVSVVQTSCIGSLDQDTFGVDNLGGYAVGAGAGN